MKKIFTLLLTFILFILPININADEITITDTENIFSTEEIDNLNNYFNNSNINEDIDVVVLIDLEYTDDIERHAYEYFYNLGYEYGLIYELNLNIREYAVVVVNIRDYSVETLLDNMYDDISVGDYYNSVKKIIDFASTVYIGGSNIENDNNNYSYNEPTVKTNEDKILECVTVASIIATVITLITLLILFGQLKTIHKNNTAYAYQDKQSLNLLKSGDIYLFTTTSRVRINTDNNHNNNSGGHINYHSGHSGGFYSGGSRKF